MLDTVKYEWDRMGTASRVVAVVIAPIAAISLLLFILTYPLLWVLAKLKHLIRGY